MRPNRLSGLMFVIAVASSALFCLTALGQQVPLAGVSSPQTGSFTPSDPNSDLTFAEFPGQIDNDDGTPGPYPGQITDITFANNPGNGASVNSGKKAATMIAEEKKMGFPTSCAASVVVLLTL